MRCGCRPWFRLCSVRLLWLFRSADLRTLAFCLNRNFPMLSLSLFLSIYLSPSLSLSYPFFNYFFLCFCFYLSLSLSLACLLLLISKILAISPKEKKRNLFLAVYFVVVWLTGFAVLIFGVCSSVFCFAIAHELGSPQKIELLDEVSFTLVVDCK